MGYPICVRKLQIDCLVLLLSSEDIFWQYSRVAFNLFYPIFYQEALAAAFGNGLSTACVVNIGAQVTQVVCVEVITLVFF